MAFRPKTGDVTAIGGNIPKTLHDKFDEAREKLKLSKTDFLTQCIEYALNDLEEPQDDRRQAAGTPATRTASVDRPSETGIERRNIAAAPESEVDGSDSQEQF